LDNHDGTSPSDKYKNIMKGESYNTSQIRRLKRKIRSLKEKQKNIRMNFIRELVNYITARTKPTVITIENLDISEMIKHDGTKDTTLHKYISESGFYYFRLLLESKCKYYGIKLRYANKYFASSKTCSHCGKKKDNLTLNDRVFICDYCGFKINRDENAAFNLLNLKDKKCDIKFA
jgi:putative transposase